MSTAVEVSPKVPPKNDFAGREFRFWEIPWASGYAFRSIIACRIKYLMIMLGKVLTGLSAFTHRVAPLCA